MQEARENTGNNMLKMMQFVFPLATQVQMNIITKYGFTADGPGIFYKIVNILRLLSVRFYYLNSNVNKITICCIITQEL